MDWIKLNPIRYIYENSIFDNPFEPNLLTEVQIGFGYTLFTNSIPPIIQMKDFGGLLVLLFCDYLLSSPFLLP